jgi:hypothetical protein
MVRDRISCAAIERDTISARGCNEVTSKARAV